jgi:hypothetical protein
MSHDVNAKRQLRLSAWALAWGTVLALCAPHRARAERAWILPIAGAGSLKTARAEVEASAATWLQQLGIEPLRARDAVALHAGARSCKSANCAADLLPELGLELAVAIAIWDQSSGGDARPSLFVTLVDRHGGRYPGEAAIEGSVAQATQAALLQAQGLRLLGPGPWLEVVGSPEGAELQIDGKSVGRVPYRGAITAGAHTLALRAPGHRSETRSVNVALAALGVQRVEFRLAPGADASVATAHARNVQHASAETRADVGKPARSDVVAEPRAAARPSPWNYVLGGGLIAVGISLAIKPVRELALDGNCVGERDAEGRCGQRVNFGGGGVAFGVGAGAALLGGAAVLLWRPLRTEVRVEAGQAGARLHVSF